MKRQLLAAGVVVLALVPGGAVASAGGSPEISVSLADDTVTPGTDATLGVRLVNEGNLPDGSIANPGLNEEVTTARGVNVSVDAGGAPFEVETPPQTFGRLARGTSHTVPFQLSVPEDAAPGTYTVPVTVSYSHTDNVAEATGARNTRNVERTFDVTVAVRETPQFRVVGVTHDVRVDATGAVEVTMANVGSATAYETAVDVRAATGDLAFGGGQSATRVVGEWAPNETRTVTYRVTAAPGAGRQAYPLTATATYERADGDTGESDPLQFTLRPDPEQRFVAESVDSDVPVGETGTLSVTLRNAGPVTVRDATVELASSHTALRFDDAASATRYVGAWRPGETRTITYQVSASDRAETRSYAVTPTVAYRDDDGDRRTYRPGALGVTPAPEQTFAYRDVSVTLRGTTARVTGRVVNTGPRPVADARIVTESAPPMVRVTSGTYPVGSLDSGESAPFELGMRVQPGTRPGPRELGVSVRYDDAGRTYTSDTTPVRVLLRTDEDDLAVEAVNATLGVDTSNTVRVRLRNVGDTELTDLHARLAVEPPYESESPRAYVASLAPGESATVTFEVTTPEDGVSTTDAIPVNVTAETPADQQVRYGPFLVPVTTTTSGGAMGSVQPLGIGAAAVVLLVAGGWWWFN